MCACSVHVCVCVCVCSVCMCVCSVCCACVLCVCVCEEAKLNCVVWSRDLTFNVSGSVLVRDGEEGCVSPHLVY